MSEIRAIETRYKGWRFRSRLEARWAVFFDRMGIPWEYEADGFQTSHGGYLPDFRLFGCLFAEVKPLAHAEAAWPKITAFVEETGLDLLVLIDAPDEVWYPVLRQNGGGDWLDFAWSAEKGRPWLHYCGPERPDPEYLCLDPKFSTAVTAARSARFEHGERP